MKAVYVGILFICIMFCHHHLESCSYASCFFITKIQFSIFDRINIFGTLMTVLAILLSVLTYCLRKIWEKNFLYEKDALPASIELSYRYFSLAEIKLGTQNFSEAFVIGRGGFGKVYKGFIGGIPGIPEIVAIKRLDSYSGQGAREFWTEIETLSKLQHIHLVSLIGYCNECQEMILVYEYIPGGTLADNLYKFTRKGRDCAPLSWEQRLRICIGAARGLDYLHTGSKYGVIHRDVKDTNILLDENLVAKISDFGLSKLEKVTQSKSYVSTKVKGTFGYLDPAYFSTERLTRKSDVYAFGMVMLVVLSGRPAVDTGIPEEPHSLLFCFRECMAEDDLTKIVDPILQGEISLDKLREFVKIFDNCLRPMPKERPTMAQVVASLEQALEQHRNPLKSAVEEGILVGSPTRGKDSESRGEDYALFRKPLRGWPWKACWNKSTSDISYKEILQYNLREIRACTSNFTRSNRIGEGGFFAVYRGTLPNGQQIAVQRLSRSSAAEEFKYEIALVFKLQHQNLIRLLGYCSERGEKILIYEFVPNNSLNHFLFDPEKRALLEWSTRYKIIEGIARGLLYLHEGKIIHRDLNAGNVLLDQNMNPKIAYFGLARLIEIDQIEGNTSKIAGTFGYMAPEYALHGLYSVKSDVFSFGVLVLEIISGRKNSNFSESHCGIDPLLTCVWRQWRDRTPLVLVDPSLGDSYLRDEVIQCIQIGLLCVQGDATERPTMASVVAMLNSYSVTLPTPNPPAFCGLSKTDSFPKELPSEPEKPSTRKSVAELSRNDFSITELCPR